YVMVVVTLTASPHCVFRPRPSSSAFFLFYKHPAPTAIYTLSLHDALPISAAATPNLVLLPDRLETPANHQWSVGIGRRLSDHLVLNVDYLHQHMTDLPVTVMANQPNPVTNQRPLTSRYGNINLWGSFGDAKFRAVLTSVTFDHGPTRVSAAYTLGWA